MGLRWSELLVWAALSASVQAQIKILSPDSLKKDFERSGAIINGGTALFGAPYYGEHVLGRLRGTTLRGGSSFSTCVETDYELADLQGTIETQGERIHDIIVMEHNAYCTACKKVRIAQAKGAHAVILVDLSGDSEKQVQEKILGDDGWGSEVKIPSILVSRATGEKIFAAMRQEQVVVELRWDIPQAEVVTVDFWWSSGAKDAHEFLKKFKDSAELLANRMQFMPHYYVFDVSSETAYSMGNLCTDSSATAGVRHCAPDPDGPGPITGADVANEDVRQICLWHKTAVASDPLVDGLFSQFWWDYVNRVYDYCPWEERTFSIEDMGKNGMGRFGSETCSYELMVVLGVDIADVQRCVRHHSDQLLEESARENAWSEQAIRINGWRYRDALDPETVLKAVCAGFVNKENICEALMGSWAPLNFFMLFRHRAYRSLSKNSFEWLIACICILSVVNCFLYRRHIRALLKRQMREEVMLEVQSQMADYAKLGGDNL